MINDAMFRNLVRVVRLFPAIPVVYTETALHLTSALFIKHSVNKLIEILSSTKNLMSIKSIK